MDALSYLLQTVQLRTSVYATIRLRPPWGVRIPAGAAAAFHALVAGSCWLQLDTGEPPVALGPGDVVVLPHGHAHTFYDDPRSPVHTIDPVTPAGPRPEVPAGAEPDPASTAVLCGHLWFDDPGTNPLVAMLPSLLHARGEASGIPAGRLRPVLELIALESGASTPGGHALLTRLSDVIVIQTIRAHLARLPAEAPGWLHALRDPQLGEALHLIHRYPGRAWTVASLATQVGLSRSVFAARFARSVGEAPLRYLTRWRMQHARRLLRTTNTTTARIAAQVGYLTEPAFSRAFKRETGTAPSVYRRSRQGSPSRSASVASGFEDAPG